MTSLSGNSHNPSCSCSGFSKTIPDPEMKQTPEAESAERRMLNTTTRKRVGVSDRCEVPPSALVRISKDDPPPEEQECVSSELLQQTDH